MIFINHQFPVVSGMLTLTIEQNNNNRGHIYTNMYKIDN